MLTIFHGDNLFDSRAALDQALSSHPNNEILRLENKEISPELVSQFLDSPSLFSTPKTLVLLNPFSLIKTQFTKVEKLINTTAVDCFLWQDKLLTLAQLKSFPKAKVQMFRLPNYLFSSLNAIKPGSFSRFLPLFQKTLATQPYDLYLYLLKNHLRRQLLQKTSGFTTAQVKTSYLQLIDLDYQTKTGQLPIPKEVALERIFFSLLA